MFLEIDVLAQITELDMIANKVRYHTSCKRAYINRARCQSLRRPWNRGDAHNEAFKSLTLHINTTLITNQGLNY